MMSIYRWDAQTRQGKWEKTAALPQSDAAQIPEHEVWWIDLANSSEAEEHAVFNEFLKIHPLSVEDMTRPRREPDRRPHFPKVEEFHDYLFVVINPLKPGILDKAATKSGHHHRHQVIHSQLCAVLTRGVLITHHYDALPSIEAVQQFLTRHMETCARGTAYLFQLILDAIVDEYAPVVDRMADVLDAVETRIFHRTPQGILATLIQHKRRILALRKTLILEREVLLRLTRGEFKLINEREIVYYRNVYDHLVRYAELVESARELVTDLMQIYLAAMSNRLNSIMKVLAMISTIVLPMSLIASIYGMNFRHGMAELDWEYGYFFALGLMGLTALGSIGFFRWKKWL